MLTTESHIEVHSYNSKEVLQVIQCRDENYCIVEQARKLLYLNQTIYMTIYIIDDNAIDLIIGQKILEKTNSDFNIVVCQDPQLALQQILDGSVQPYVILLDWFMPVLPAEEWLKRYSEQQQITRVHETFLKVESK